MANPFGKSLTISLDAIINAIHVVIMSVPMPVWVSSCGRFVLMNLLNVVGFIVVTVMMYCYFLSRHLSHYHYLY